MVWWQIQIKQDICLFFKFSLSRWQLIDLIWWRRYCSVNRKLGFKTHATFIDSSKQKNRENIGCTICQYFLSLNFTWNRIFVFILTLQPDLSNQMFAEPIRRMFLERNFLSGGPVENLQPCLTFDDTGYTWILVRNIRFTL